MEFLVPVGIRDVQVLRLTIQWTDELGDHAESYTLQVR
jgi:hypothetical protein